MKNIVLIGMPGCGKSTIGVVLAKVIGYKFLDSDILIQEMENRKLSQIIREEGIEGFNKIENRINSALSVKGTVIATGGSVVYGAEAMENLRKNGLIIFIKLPFLEIQNRLGDLLERGITVKEGQSLKEIYCERAPLYEKYSDITVNTDGLSIRESVEMIEKEIEYFMNN